MFNLWIIKSDIMLRKKGALYEIMPLTLYANIYIYKSLIQALFTGKVSWGSLSKTYSVLGREVYVRCTIIVVAVQLLFYGESMFSICRDMDPKIGCSFCNQWLLFKYS